MTASKVYAQGLDMTREDWALFERTPKTVLYAMAKHLSAASDGDSYEESLESGSYQARMLFEWTALYCAGIVKQKPIKVTAANQGERS